MATDYEIEAELRLNTRAATAGLRTFSDRMGGLGQKLRGFEGMFTGVVAQAVAFGGAYLGVSALVGGFSELATEAFRFQQEVGGAQLGLRSIMAQVEGVTDAAGNWQPVGFERAEALSADAYQHMQDMAITSSATSAELLGIFQATYGAARSAGSSMEQVYELTANASTAAAALGIDFQQASRDMGAMLRGGAGLDVKLFSSLRSMNAIAMDAQEFNALAPEERIAVLSRALQGFEEANAAYGRSLPGALSTTTDLFELFRGAFFGPAFQKMADLLNELNAYLIANKDAIRAFLTEAGEKFRDFLVGGVERAREAFGYVTAHWTEIVAKVNEAVARFRAMAPLIASWGATFVKMQIAASALGAALRAGAWISSAVASFTELAGVVGAGEAAAAGGAGAAAGATGGTLGAMLAPFAAAVGAVVLAIASVKEAFDAFYDTYFGPALGELQAAFTGVGGEIMALFSEAYDALTPFFRLIGGPVVAAVIAVFRIFATVLKWVVAQARFVVAIFARIVEVLRPVIDFLAEGLTLVVTKIGDLAGAIGSMIDKVQEFLRVSFADPEDTPELPEQRGTWVDSSGLHTPGGEYDFERRAETAMTGAGPTNNNNFDMRGSRITVNQEFREADPGRVALRMIEDIQRFSEQRIQSGFAPAFTR